LPGTANSSMNASSKFRRLSICASLPVLLKVAVPQLVMAIAAAQRSTFQAMKFFADIQVHKGEVVRLSILRQLASACQDMKGLESYPLLFRCLL
jgi:hypothetical protein